MYNRILQYINRNSNFATEDKGLITIYHGFLPSLAIYPVLSKWWKGEQEQFPYPTVRLNLGDKQVAKVGIPMDVWHVRSDIGKAIVIPDTLIYTMKYNVGEDIYEIPTDELTYVDLDWDSEEEELDKWEEELGNRKKPRKARRPRK